MELIKILEEQILNEGRLEDAFNKYVNDWKSTYNGNEDEFFYLVNDLSSYDPSGNNKYLDWMVEQLIKDRNNKDKIIDLINRFDKIGDRLVGEAGLSLIHDALIPSAQEANQESLKQYRPIFDAPKMISNYPDLSTLETVVSFVENSPTRKEIKVLSKSEALPVYEDHKYEIVRPLTHRASCHYGRGTTWCTKLKDNDSYFNDYTNTGYLFYFIDKYEKNNIDNPLFKLALRTDKNGKQLEFRTKFNKNISLPIEDYLPPQMVSAIHNHIARDNMVYTVINKQFLTQFFNVKKGPEGFILQHNKKGTLVLYSDYHKAQLYVTINSKNKKIEFDLRVDNGDGETRVFKSDNIDNKILTVLMKTIDVDNGEFNIKNEQVKDELSGYVKNQIFDFINNQQLNMSFIGVARRLNKDITNNENRLVGNFDGDWRFDNVEVNNNNNNTIIISVGWPEDPDEDKLTIKFHLDINDIDNAKFTMVGYLNEGSGSAKNIQEYDEESDIFNLEECVIDGKRLDIECVIDSFKGWCIEKMNESLEE